MKTKYSKGEEKLRNILLRASLPFEKEKTFTDLRNGKYRFDFYIPSLNICIEYDSEIHFKQIKHFHKTNSAFKAAQERDRRKNSYCLSRGIRLYRIPYSEINNLKSVEDIFKEKFLVKSKWHNDIYKP